MQRTSNPGRTEGRTDRQIIKGCLQSGALIRKKLKTEITKYRLMKWPRKTLLFHVNDDSYLKDLYAKNTSGGFKEGGGWNIWCKHFRVNSHMIAPMKKGLLRQTVHNVILHSCRHMVWIFVMIQQLLVGL